MSNLAENNCSACFQKTLFYLLLMHQLCSFHQKLDSPDAAHQQWLENKPDWVTEWNQDGGWEENCDLNVGPPASVWDTWEDRGTQTFAAGDQPVMFVVFSGPTIQSSWLQFSERSHGVTAAQDHHIRLWATTMTSLLRVKNSCCAARAAESWQISSET